MLWVTYTCQNLELRSIDWSNRFTFGEFIVSYCTFEMAREVLEKNVEPMMVAEQIELY